MKDYTGINDEMKVSKEETDMTRKYRDRKYEMSVYRRGMGLNAVLFLMVIVLGVILGLIFFNREDKEIKAPAALPSEKMNHEEDREAAADKKEPEAIADYEVDDDMVAWGDSYTAVFRQGAGRDICTGIDRNVYDYALVPNRQELVLDVSEAEGYLKGTFVLSAFNRSDSYFREIEVEILDVGSSDPFCVATMNSDTRNSIDLSVKLAGHEKIVIRFGYAGGDVYLLSNGLYISQNR